jgi:hypothetical protein
MRLNHSAMVPIILNIDDVPEFLLGFKNAFESRFQYCIKASLMKKAGTIAYAENLDSQSTSPWFDALVTVLVQISRSPMKVSSASEALASKASSSMKERLCLL